MAEQYYYSALSGGFYRGCDRDIYEASENGWPHDAVAVSEEEYKKLFDGQATGKIISADEDGRPVLTTPVIDWQNHAEQQRQDFLNRAGNVTSDWRTELALGMISDEDRAALVLWMTYIRALKSLDLSVVNSESAFDGIEWPALPGE